MFAKKILMAASAGLVFASGAALAERLGHTIMVEAQVPTSSFYVEPIGDWMSNPLQLAWNMGSGTLEPVSKQFEMKSTLGSISAHLQYAAVMASGHDNFDLKITVAGKELGLTPTVLYTKAQAATRQRSEFKVEAVAPVDGFKPGRYEGNVALMFDSVLES